MKSVDTIVSPSRFTRRIHHERGFARPIEHLPYFVPKTEQSQALPGPPPHPRPYFLFVGRLEKIKGLQTLLPVFRKYPHADLLVAGTGNYEAELHKQAAELSNVVFLGSLVQGRLQELYEHALAVLVPSICYEVFGIIILEAYRQRTPVIVRALGGLEEVVEESQGGFIYRSDEELLTAMEKLRTDRELQRSMGERGHRKYFEHWSQEAHLDMYFKVLEETAKRKFGRPLWEFPNRSMLAIPPTQA